MKRYLLSVLAVLILSCFLISCNPEAEGGKGDDTPAIAGTWTYTEKKSEVATYTWDLTLNADGSFTMDEKYNGDPSQTHKGTFSADGTKWVGTVTNILDFFPLDSYTSEHPSYAFKDAVDESHWKLGFSVECEDPLDYEDTYEWDAEKQIYYKEQSVVPERSEYWFHKFGASSYEYNSTNITKDGSDNEMYKMEIVFMAKGEFMDPIEPAATKLFAKFYDFDMGKCSWKITSSYKKDGDTLSFYWQGSEKTFTKK